VAVVELELAPKTKRPKGEVCCEPVAQPQVGHSEAADLAKVARALGDPIRLQLVDVLRRNAGKVCVCELVPLFDVSQPTISHHLKVLREAGLVESERRGLWVYYYVRAGALDGLSGWLE
jgi:ArsR family transcriptional regulator, arsenate/arsenite/antimonite-responsive transcriptional repressor